jgi:negative elongation factor C/D
MEHSQWRQLLYRLSEEHEESLMLSFAIQKISDAGHHSEIVSLASASNYFSIFNRVLLHLIDEVCNTRRHCRLP